MIAEALEERQVWKSCMKMDATDIILALTFLIIANIGWFLYLSGSVVQSVRGPRDGCVTRCIPNPRSNTAALPAGHALQHQNAEFVSMQSRISP